jgi:hypothetical protein
MSKASAGRVVLPGQWLIPNQSVHEVSACHLVPLVPVGRLLASWFTRGQREFHKEACHAVLIHRVAVMPRTLAELSGRRHSCGNARLLVLEL